MLPIYIINYGEKRLSVDVDRKLTGYGGTTLIYDNCLPQKTSEFGREYTKLGIIILICSDVRKMREVFFSLGDVCPNFEDETILISPNSSDEIVTFCVSNGIRHLFEEIRRHQLYVPIMTINNRYVRNINRLKKDLAV